MTMCGNEDNIDGKGLPRVALEDSTRVVSPWGSKRGLLSTPGFAAKVSG
jgi:hypothetical protein